MRPAIPLDYSISERDYNEISHVIENHSYDFALRPDDSVKLSLAEYGWIAHESSDDSWTVILRVTRNSGGPGFRILVIEREDMKSWYEENWEDTHLGNEKYGYNHFTKMWNDESDFLLVQTYIKNNGSLRLPSHLGDTPWIADDLIDILEESNENVN